MGRLKEKWNGFKSEAGSNGKTVQSGIYAAAGIGVFFVFGGIVLGSIPFTGFPPVLLIDFVLSVIALIGFVEFIINGLSFLKNGIEDILRFPGKAMRKAKAEQERKEREQAEAELQAKITEGIASYKTEADSGNAEAMRQVAKVYSTYGKDSIAISWYTKAAQLGDIEAQLTLAGEYKVIGAIEAKKWLSEVEKNPKAGPEQKEAARVKKIDIEQYEFRQAAEAEAAERRRRAEAEMIEQQKKLPITGDFYVMRPYNRECANVGNACTYCARRTWHGRNWGTGINCGFNK
uniref:hypothetical protein n=1 Tax=Gemmiger formicilis TaxID=745368 RepID=UPI0040299EB9